MNMRPENEKEKLKRQFWRQFKERQDRLEEDRIANERQREAMGSDCPEDHPFGGTY